MATNDVDMINRIAASEMGVAPPDPVPDPASKDSGKDTPEGQAQQDGKVKTEADNMDAAPIIEVDWGNGTKRKMTPEQIRSLSDRYTSLNDRNARMKPVLSLVEKIMENTGHDPDTAAGFLTEAIRRAAASNVQMGGDGKTPQRPGEGTPPTDKGADPDPFASWEEEHQVALPPGYREQQNSIREMQAALSQMTGLLQQVLGRANGTTDAAQAARQEADTANAARIAQAIQTNLNEAQVKAGVPDEAVDDFMVFIAERGYDMPDFADPDLTLRVMQDFASVRSQDEFGRLKAINQRRQAFTGTLPAAPASGDDPTSGADPNQAMIDRLAAQRLG